MIGTAVNKEEAFTTAAVPVGFTPPEQLLVMEGKFALVPIEASS